MSLYLCTIDWTAVSAIVSALMVCVTFYTISQNKKQLKELKRQWEEENRPRIYPRIITYNKAYFLEFFNSGKVDAFDVDININQTFIENLPEKPKELINDWTKSPFFVKAGQSVYAFIGWCEEISKKWVSADFNLEIHGKYNRLYTIEFSLPVSQFSKRNMAVRTPIEHALEDLAKGLVRPNRTTHILSSQESLESIDMSITKIAKYIETNGTEQPKYIQRRDNEKQNAENREANAIENEENRKTQNKIMLYQISTQNLHLFKESCLALLDAYNYNRFVQICNLFIQQKKSPLEQIRIGFMEINKAHRSFLMNFIPSAPKMGELIEKEEELFKIYNAALLDIEVVISYLTFSKDYIKEHISTDNQASEILSMIIAKNITMLDSIEPKKWLDAILNQRLDIIDPELSNSIWDLISDVYLGEKARVNKIIM